MRQLDRPRTIIVDRDNDRSRPLDPFRDDKPSWTPGSDDHPIAPANI